MSILIKNVSFNYKKSAPIYSNFSLEIPKMSIYGLLGANGSGKTTLIKLMLGILTPNVGEIVVENLKINGSYRFYSTIGTLIENTSIYNHLTGYDNLYLYSLIYKIPKNRIDYVLDIVGLNNNKKTKVFEYSLGMKQRLSLATSIIHNPSILILDEPLNGLDPKGIKEIKDLIQQFNIEEKKTIIMSSHSLSEVENTCSDVGIIDLGKLIYSGNINELIKKNSYSNTVTIECDSIERIADILAPISNLNIKIKKSGVFTIDITIKDQIPEVVKLLTKNDIKIFSVYKTNNSLNDVFLSLTK